MSSFSRMRGDFEEGLRLGIDPIAMPSIAYGVARGEETLLLNALGVADKARGLRATPQTSYAMASVTKPMTATAVAILAERGLVDLNAPIDDYLATKLCAQSGDAREATVRRVADHTAGLPLHYQFYYADEPYARPPFEETIRRYGKLITPPGERHHYSNLGYGLLDDLIGRVSGVPYGRFMAEELFEPLGMDRSAIGIPSSGEAAIAYGPDGVGYPPYDFDHPGGSAAYSSVEDLLAFGRFHLGGPGPLSLPARRATHAPTWFEAGRGYGFGWSVTDRFGLRVVQHTGGMGGVRTILRLVPDLDLVLVFLANGEGDLPFRAADDALALFDKGFHEALRAERETPKSATRAELPEEAIGLWTGAIETLDDSLPFSLEIRGGDALARLDGQESFVDDLRWVEGRLVGVFDGDVGTEDAGRRPYRLHLDLGLRGDAVDGAVAAITQVETLGGSPGRRQGNALAYWAQLDRP